MIWCKVQFILKKNYLWFWPTKLTGFWKGKNICPWIEKKITFDTYVLIAQVVVNATKIWPRRPPESEEIFFILQQMFSFVTCHWIIIIYVEVYDMSHLKGTVQLNHVVTSINRSPFSCPVIEKFIWNESLLRPPFLCLKGDLLMQVWL